MSASICYHCYVFTVTSGLSYLPHCNIFVVSPSLYHQCYVVTATILPSLYHYHPSVYYPAPSNPSNILHNFPPISTLSSFFAPFYNISHNSHLSTILHPTSSASCHHHYTITVTLRSLHHPTPPLPHFHQPYFFSATPPSPCSQQPHHLHTTPTTHHHSTATPFLTYSFHSYPLSSITTTTTPSTLHFFPIYTTLPLSTSTFNSQPSTLLLLPAPPCPPTTSLFYSLSSCIHFSRFSHLHLISSSAITTCHPLSSIFLHLSPPPTICHNSHRFSLFLLLSIDAFTA